MQARRFQLPEARCEPWSRIRSEKRPFLRAQAEQPLVCIGGPPGLLVVTASSVINSLSLRSGGRRGSLGRDFCRQMDPGRDPTLPNPYGVVANLQCAPMQVSDSDTFGRVCGPQIASFRATVIVTPGPRPAARSTTVPTPAAICSDAPSFVAAADAPCCVKLRCTWPLWMLQKPAMKVSALCAIK